MQKDQEVLAAKITNLKEQESGWQRRALEVAFTDQPKALECLRRRKVVLTKIQPLSEQLTQHELVTEQLSNNIVQLQNEIEKLKLRRNLMRTRQTRADALRVAQSIDGPPATDIHDVVARWEDKATESEAYSKLFSSLRAGKPKKIDPLDEELTFAEEQKALQAELATLLARAVTTGSTT